MKPHPVRKAATPEMIALYDAAGALIGVCDADALTPVTDTPGGTSAMKTANEDPAMPVATTSSQATGRAGEEPAMGTAEAAPQLPAGQVVTDADDDTARQRRAGEVRKALSGGSLTAAEQNDLADGLNRAAITGFARIRAVGLTAR